MAEEEKDEVLDKKTAKAQEKAARAEAKAQKKADRKKAKELNDDLDMDDETSTGGKIAVFFVTLIIILICGRIWLNRTGSGIKGCSLCEQNPAGQCDRGSVDGG